MNKYAYAKVNIFLKISGKRNDYHEIESRFVRIKSLYDIVGFAKGSFSTFTIDGEFSCEPKKNTIYKAYEILCKKYSEVEEYFKSHKVRVFKNIPEFAGLGGGSSNAAAFILMVNEACNLELSIDDLVKIGIEVGADVPFFLYDVDSANISGIGEIVEPFNDDIPYIGTKTPPIKCDTKEIYNTFRENFYKEISEEEVKKLKSMSSKSLLENYSIETLNDLYEPAVYLYPMLKAENFGITNKSFFSGSGSTFFFVENMD